MIKINKATFCILPLLLALVGPTVGQNGCEFTDFKRENSPILVRTTGSIKRFLDPRTPIQIPNDGNITVYCNIRSTDNTEDDWLPNQQFVVKCKNGTISVERLWVWKYFICHVPGYFPYPNEDCEDQHYVTGLKVDNTKIMFASVCYNMENRTTQYVKYVPTPRGYFLSQQERNNPVPSNLVSLNGSYLDMRKMAFRVLPDDEIREHMQYLVGDMSNALSYSEASLLPSHIFSPILNHQDGVNTIIWWNQLRHGNWKIIQILLTKQTDVEVYAGKSHVATVDDWHNHKVDLEFEKLNGYKIVAPLYVWNFVKHKNPLNDVVLIGINSPYVYTGEMRNGYSTHLSGTACYQDVCSEVEWLKNITTLKLSAFGYVFCCKPSDLKIKLDGMPSKFVESLSTPAPDRNFEITESYKPLL